MPEGHVIHRLARALTSRFGGRPVRSSSPQGRFAEASELLDGTVLDRADAVGKHLLVYFEADRVVWVHLGLIGKFRFVEPGPPLSPQTLRWRLWNERAVAELRGPQWCRLITSEEAAEVVASSGPDPIRPDADPRRAWEALTRSRRPIAAMLMDQKVFAGVGNIFRAETLFRLGIDPYLPASELPREVFDELWDDLVGLMRAAVGTGRIDTVEGDHSPEAMNRPPREDPHGGEVYVYRRAGFPCLVCGTEVARAELAGRNLYWCPQCQPEGSTGGAQ
jgi:endonuclease-8/formamidopyrimidine-DNA glycosylase